MNTNRCLSKLAATLSATAANWDDPQAASTPCVFTVCATQRELDAASAIEKKTVKMLIRQTISPSQRYSRSLTVELTRRRESKDPPPHNASCETRFRRSRPTIGC